MNNWTTSHDRVLAQRHAEGWMFLIEAARDLRTTGAIAPSGKALARALTEPVRAQAPRPLAVLEAGAGTGAVTRTLLPQLPRGSRLDIVEANPRFAARLRHLVATHPHLAAGAAQVNVHQTHVERLDTDRRYDAIVSGLPLTNFTPVQVERIMAPIRPAGAFIPTLTLLLTAGALARGGHISLPLVIAARGRCRGGR